MTSFKDYEHTPHLAELKVSYRNPDPAENPCRPNPPRERLTGPDDCEAYLRRVWDHDTIELREEFLVICLNSAFEVLGWVKLAAGAMNSVSVDPRLVFGVALQTASYGIVLAHNHPGGTVKPSLEDIEMSERLRDGGELLGVRVLDHLILTRNDFYCFSSEWWW